VSAGPLPLAGAAQRLRGKPGRPRKPLLEQVAALLLPPRLLDLHGAAAYLGGLSSWTIRDLEGAGVLKRVRIPTRNGGELRKVLFDVRDLDALILKWKDETEQ